MAKIQPIVGPGQIWRHLKSGKEYEIVHASCRVQVSQLQGLNAGYLEDQQWIAYTDPALVAGTIYFRMDHEFLDGRFSYVGEGKHPDPVTYAHGDGPAVVNYAGTTMEQVAAHEVREATRKLCQVIQRWKDQGLRFRVDFGPNENGKVVMQALEVTKELKL